MSHLGASELPILAAVVTGAIAFTFAVADFAVFGRSSFGVEIAALALVMGLFTGYHVLLVVDHNLTPTTTAFGGAIETVVATVAVGVVAMHHFAAGDAGG
ncbi:MAG: hypothetical protein ABEJ59_01950 [Halanaeroarchaeum sp.]